MKISLEDILLVFVGGGVGAVSRWIISGYIQERSSHSIFPWGTLAVNVIGSFILGFVMGAFIIHGVFSYSQRLFLATGFAGALTTFSTFMYESMRLMARSSVDAFGNLLTSIILGLVAVYAGYVVAGLVYG